MTKSRWVLSVSIAGYALAVAWLVMNIFFLQSEFTASLRLTDEAILVQGAERILNGQIPHRDFYSFYVGGAYYPIVAAFRMFGDSYTSVRILNFLVALGIGFGLTRLAGKFSRWMSPVSALLYVVFAFSAWPIVSHHWFLFLIAVWSTTAILQARTSWHFTLTGALAASGAAAVHHKALLLVAAQLLFVILYRRVTMRDRKPALWYAVGAIAVGIVGVLTLVLSGTWPEFFRQVFENNVAYYQQQAQGYFFSMNMATIASLATAAILGLPLLQKKFFSDRQREAYALIWMVYVALTIANFYFLDWTHFGFNVSLASILGLVFLRQTVRSMYHQIRASAIPSLFINYFFATLLTSGFMFYLVMIHNTAIFGITDGLNFRDAQAQEYPHSLFVDSTWKNHFVQPFPIVNELVRTKLAGRRIWLLPYASGYYYYNGLANPTSFDLMPLNHLTAVDERRLRDELSASVDAVVYLPLTWKLFDANGPLMTWINDVFPYRQDFANHDIRVFSRQPL